MPFAFENTSNLKQMQINREKNMLKTMPLFNQILKTIIRCTIPGKYIFIKLIINYLAFTRKYCTKIEE